MLQYIYIQLVSNITNYHIMSGIDQMISSGLERFTIILQLKIYITCFVIIPYCYQSDKPFVSSWNRREAAPLYDMILYTNTNINHGLSNNKPPISHMLKEIIAINLIILSQAVEIEYKQRQMLLFILSTFHKYFKPYQTGILWLEIYCVFYGPPFYNGIKGNYKSLFLLNIIELVKQTSTCCFQTRLDKVKLLHNNNWAREIIL